MKMVPGWVLVLLAVVLSAGAAAQVRTGAWVDEIVFFEEPNAAKGVEMVRAGTADLYVFGVVGPRLTKEIAETVEHAVFYEISHEITFNPYGPEFRDGRLNPFAVPAIREQMNRLIDRDRIV